MSATTEPLSLPGELPASSAERSDERTLRRFLEQPLVIAAGVLLLTLLAAVLRYRALGSALWLDESQAVAIAHRPFTDIPHALRLDGSPPLYYVLLHAWMAVAGASDARVHLLSAGLAALCVPAGWLAGRLAAGPRAAWLAAALLTTNTFLSTYADQARMYTLLALVALLVVAAFLAVFVHRRRALSPLFGLALAAALYTHNWSFFLAAGCAAAVVPCWLAAGRDRRVLIDAAIGLAVAAVLYAPWTPILIDQIRHTGAPWSTHPGHRTVIKALADAVGGMAAGSVLLLAGGFGVARLARLRTPRSTAAIALLVACLTTLIVAVAYCELSLAWSPRYLAVLAGPLTVLAAVGLAAAGTGLALGALALALALTVGQPHFNELHNKTNVPKMAAFVRPDLRPGDLVVSTQPEQVPSLVRYLPRGLRYFTPYGPVADPAIMSWRDAKSKLAHASVTRDLDPLIASLRPGQRLLLVNPYTEPQGQLSGWAHYVRLRKREWNSALLGDHRLHRVAAWLNHRHAALSAVSAQVFEKR